MCWDMNIIHRNDNFLIDANYWSCLATDLYFDPLLRDYIQRAASICLNNLVREIMPILAKKTCQELMDHIYQDM